MPKLPALKPKQVLKKLKKLGFIEDHTSDSHIIMYHPVSKKRAVVPYHLKDIPKGTLSSLLRETNISRDEFIKA